KTSTVPAWKLVANKKAPDSLKPSASPLYTAPEAELLTAITALVESTLAFHPAIVPSSVANNSVLGAEAAPDAMTNPLVALVTTPVGADLPPLVPGTGIVTTWGEPDGIGWPVPSYVVALPDPLSEIQIPLL